MSPLYNAQTLDMSLAVECQDHDLIYGGSRILKYVTIFIFCT